MMKLLHGSALESWQRVKALGLRLQHTTDPDERKRLENAIHDASQHFRRTYTEQRVRREAR